MDFDAFLHFLVINLNKNQLPLVLGHLEPSGLFF